MIEMGFVELGHLRILAKMVFVAGYASVSRTRKVKSALEVDLLLDLTMARQALAAVDFLAALMTLRAIRYSFKAGMRA